MADFPASLSQLLRVDLQLETRGLGKEREGWEGMPSGLCSHPSPTPSFTNGAWPKGKGKGRLYLTAHQGKTGGRGSLG